MPYNYARISIPSTVDATTAKTLADSVARATGWVEESEIANSTLHSSSGSYVYRYKTKYLIDGTIQVYLLLGLTATVVPQPILGALLLDNSSYSAFQSIYRSDNGAADVIVYSTENLITIGVHLKSNTQPPNTLFVYLEKPASDLAEEELVMPIYVGTLATFGSATSIKRPTTSPNFTNGYAGVVVPSAAGYSPASGSPIERAAVLTGFGPVYLVKPNGLGMVPLSQLRYAHFPQGTAGFASGTLVSDPPSLVLSASNATSPAYAFIALTS
jgi:hypothetical protein